MRNKGYEAALFAGAMFVLKEIGASYYIGETNMQNEWMKDVFEKNGCQSLSSTGEICEKVLGGSMMYTRTRIAEGTIYVKAIHAFIRVIVSKCIVRRLEC